MSTDIEKDKIIRGVYYDADTGFGSVRQTYDDAHKIMNSITYAYVKDFLERQKSRQFKAYRGFNSYIADSPLEEIQLDISDFTESGAVNDGFRWALVGIDIFTKIATAIPMKTKQTHDCVNALKLVFEKIGICKVLYHDNEGGFSSTEFVRLVNSHKIKQIITSAPAPFAERFISTLKDQINRRLEGLEIEKQEWVKILPNVLNKYNNTVHSSIKMTPNEAKHPDHRLQVWLNIKSKATFNRKYEPLKVGDYVRTYVKKKSHQKQTDKRWSEEIYKITFIKDNQYMINDANRKRVWSRHELLKIKGAEGKDD